MIINYILPDFSSHPANWTRMFMGDLFFHSDALDVISLKTKSDHLCNVVYLVIATT